ncbi:MAG: FimV/HubP family polar landmark protein [Lysobacteraceae bacterium]
MRITVSVLLAVAAFLSPLSAWALGLGQIQVLSQRDQPLLAEIPIISSDTSELEALQARLASPETFTRIGLSPPQGIVADLQFSVALDARGRPVIRVTSAVPVQQSLLTFLVEVDWGKGRLVREYSALLDTPQTAAAPAQPPIKEATVDPGNAVVRLPDPPPAPANPLEAATPTPVPLPPTPTPAGQTASVPDDALSAPVPMPIPLPAEPTETATATPIEVVSGETTRAVRPGETLGGIAASLERGYSLDQTILALLRANPEAFIDGNANRLKAGAVLRIPDDASIAQYTPDEAAVVVREQAAQWRGTGRALPQPPAVVGSPTGDSVPAATTPRPPRATRPTAQARLEIVPPSASDARRAGTRSGVSAGGEGEMLRQQELQQTKETLVARDAEVQELKARVAELEQLKQQQDQLVALKDSELAAAQQRLATTQAADAKTPVSLGPWLGVGAGLLMVGLLAGWWLRRRQTLAGEVKRDRQRPAPASPDATDVDPDVQRAFVDEEVPPQAESLPVEPAWNRIAKPAEPEPERPAPPARGVPTWHSGDFEVGPLNPAPPGQGRLDLARAYLDMGDRDTARSLLKEVATRGDSTDVRRQAEDLLRELG